MPPQIRTGPVRARDLRANIKELGFESGVVATLELMLDEHAQDRQHIREMVEIVEQCTNIVNSMMQVGTSITQEMDQLKRERNQGDEIDHS